MTFVCCGRIFGLVVVESISRAGRTRLCKTLTEDAEKLGFLTKYYAAPVCDFDSFESTAEYIENQFHLYRKACDDMVRGRAQLVFLDGWFYTARAHVELRFREAIFTREEYETLLFLMNTLLLMQPFMPELILYLDESLNRCKRNCDAEPWMCRPSREELMEERRAVRHYNLLAAGTYEVTAGTLENGLAAVPENPTFKAALSLLCPSDPQLRPMRLDPRFTQMLEERRALAPNVTVRMLAYDERAPIHRVRAGDGTPVLKTVLENIVYKVPVHNSFAHLLERNREVMNLLVSGDHRLLRELSSPNFAQ